MVERAGALGKYAAAALPRLRSGRNRSACPCLTWLRPAVTFSPSRVAPGRRRFDRGVTSDVPAQTSRAPRRLRPDAGRGSAYQPRRHRTASSRVAESWDIADEWLTSADRRHFEIARAGAQACRLSLDVHMIQELAGSAHGGGHMAKGVRGFFAALPLVAASVAFALATAEACLRVFPQLMPEEFQLRRHWQETSGPVPHGRSLPGVRFPV